MPTVNKHLPQGAGMAKALLRRAPWVELDWDHRQKSRLEVEDSLGRRVAIFLPRGTVMRGGDALVLDDGSLLTVRAAPERVMEVRPCQEHGQPGDLARAAYHLGNRHVGVDLQADHLKIEPDHVLAQMLCGLHFDVVEATAPFEPEGGAYQGAGHGHGHSHAHGHDDHTAHHEHRHGHPHDHPHDHQHTSPSETRGKLQAHHDEPELPAALPGSSA